MDLNPEFSALIKTIIAEIRPRLQSVSVFVTLHRNIASECTLELHDEGFEIINGETRQIITPPGIAVITESLTSFNAQENFIVFRFNTNAAEKYGSFNTEIFEIGPSIDFPVTTEPSMCRPYVDYDINCVNCQHVLCEIQFDRILPLPSESCEPGEWFCHQHEDETAQKPNSEDLLHTNTYFHLNYDLIGDNTIEEGKCVTCKYCSAWLGTDVGNNMRKLWFHTVALHTADSKPHQTDAYEDVLYALRAAIFDGSLTVKIVLSCQISEVQKEYILLWVIDKDLNVCLMQGNANIAEKYVCKVLYKHENCWTETVELWHKDFQNTIIDISKPMMERIAKELQFMNELIPEKFATLNDLKMSYLDFRRNCSHT